MTRSVIDTEYVVRCVCGNTLAVIKDGKVISKRHGRVIEVPMTDGVTITCEKCKRKNKIESEESKWIKSGLHSATL